MVSDVKIQNNSIGPIGLMWVVIVALKLMAVIDWSWWVVTFFPLIATAGVFAVCGVIGLLCGLLVWIACRD